MKFQVTRAFSVTRNGRRTEYKLGQRIGEAAYKRLNARQQSYLLSARKAATLNAYTNEERSFIASLYNEGCDRKSIESAFVKTFGNTHSADSVGQKVEMCKSVDTTLAGTGSFQFRDEELIVMLQDLDADRYQLA